VLQRGHCVLGPADISLTPNQAATHAPHLHAASTGQHAQSPLHSTAAVDSTNAPDQATNTHSASAFSTWLGRMHRSQSVAAVGVHAGVVPKQAPRTACPCTPARR
jgi:hypothetical protein